MPKLSILFASVRPDYANVALMNLIQSLSLGGVDYEIVCVAPFPLSGERIRYVREETPAGCYPAYQQAFEAATGDVFAFFSDDMIACPGWAHRLIDEVLERERRYFPYVGGMRAINSPYFTTAYDLYFANWPIFSRATASALGQPFGSEFVHHFGDIDLALRVWAAGGRVEMLPHRSMFVLLENARRMSPFALADRLRADLVRFRDKWAPVLGTDPQADFYTLIQSRYLEELQDGTYVGAHYPADHRFRDPQAPRLVSLPA